jgi:hypothetical protein
MSIEMVNLNIQIAIQRNKWEKFFLIKDEL